MDVKNILDFPIELLELIFNRFEWKELVRYELPTYILLLLYAEIKINQVNRCEGTCKKFLQLARRCVSVLRTDYRDRNIMSLIEKFSEGLVELHPTSFYPKPTETVSICTRATRLTKLVIATPWILEEDPIGLTNLSSLRNLRINADCVNFQTLNEVLALNRLTRLTVTTVPSAFTKKLTRLSNLIKLNVYEQDRFSVKEPWNFLTELTNIKALGVMTKKMDLDSLKNLMTPVSQMSQLTALKVYAEVIEESSISVFNMISKLSKLQLLALSSIRAPLQLDNLTGLTSLDTNITEDNIKYLPRLQQLKAVSLRTNNVKDNDVLNQLNQLPNLEKVTLTAFGMSSEFDTLTSCSKLTCLLISFSDRLNIMIKKQASAMQDKVFKRIAQLMTLRVLEIDYYSNFKELTVLTNLRSLRIFANYKETPLEEFKDVTKLKNLTRFFLETYGRRYSPATIKKKLFPNDSHVFVE